MQLQNGANSFYFPTTKTRGLSARLHNTVKTRSCGISSQHLSTLFNLKTFNQSTEQQMTTVIS